MKFLISLHRSQRKEVHVFASDKDTALKTALKMNAGWQSEIVCQLGDQDAIDAEHTAQVTCEACDKIVWDDEAYVTTEDDCYLCMACYDEALKNAPDNE